jgi:hypothetical protein
MLVDAIDGMHPRGKRACLDLEKLLAKRLAELGQ